MRTVILITLLWLSAGSYGQTPQHLLLLGPQTTSGPTWALVDSASKSNNSSATSVVTTASTNSTGANLLIVVVADYPNFSSVGTVTDSKSNTYTQAVTVATVNVRLTIFYKYAGTVGTSHTFTYTTSGASYPTIYAYAYSGAASSPLDQTNSNSTTSSGTTLSSGSITPTQSNELLITAMCAYPGQTQPTISGGGFDNSMRMGWRAYQPNWYANSSAAIQIQTSAAASNPSWTYSTNTQTAVAIASFKNQ